jgi:hypothetical protein
LAEIGVAIPIVEAGTDRVIGVASWERWVAALESVVLDCGDESRDGGDAMRLCVQDDDCTEVVLADGETGIDIDGGAELFERPLMRTVRTSGVDSEGTVGKELNELTNCALDTRDTEESREA